MPIELSAADLTALVQELRVLEEARIDKFYQRDDEIIVHIYKPGDKKYRLLLQPGKVFLTKFKREMPQKPPGFCMYLRKTLGGKEIERVEQYDFDRILTLHTDEDVFVAELFGQGNVVVTNKNGDVQGAMRSSDDRVEMDGQYDYPEPSPDPRELDAAALEEFPEEDVVVVLAAKIGLGGRYAEELCARAGVDKNTPVADLSGDEVEAVLDAVHDLFATLDAGELEPHVYHEDDMPVVATPVPFVTYSDAAAERYDTFSEALDTYFTEREKAEYREEQLKEYREEKERLERRLDQQERKLEGMDVAAEENQAKADLIYENYGLVEGVLDSLRAAQEQYSETQIEERLESEAAQGIPEAEAVEHLDLGNDAVTVDLDGTDVRLDLELSVEKNAEHYYQKAKDAKNKIPGLETALAETRRELEELEADDVEVDEAFEDKEEKRAKKRWYEKFRWFFSRDGFLVIGGRDTTTNDMLVKKYLEDHDIYVHADFTGAPSVAVKTEGEEVPESTLEEAGEFAVTFARSWEAGVTSEDAYWVTPDQVTQEAESGEYLPKGSFVIRGERTYMNNLPVEAAIGLYEREDGAVPMGGPPSAVEAQCDHYVVLEQGRDKPSDVGKRVKQHLEGFTEERLDLDAVIRALPPGTASVAEMH